MDLMDFVSDHIRSYIVSVTTVVQPRKKKDTAKQIRALAREKLSKLLEQREDSSLELVPERAKIQGVPSTAEVEVEENEKYARVVFCCVCSEGCIHEATVYLVKLDSQWYGYKFTAAERGSDTPLWSEWGEKHQEVLADTGD